MLSIVASAIGSRNLDIIFQVFVTRNIALNLRRGIISHLTLLLHLFTIPPNSLLLTPYEGTVFNTPPSIARICPLT